MMSKLNQHTRGQNIAVRLVTIALPTLAPSPWNIS
jgi:hypothetical protein